MPEETHSDANLTDGSLDSQIAAIDATFGTEETTGLDDGSQTVATDVALDAEHPKDGETHSEASTDKTPTDSTGAEGEDKPEIKEGEDKEADEAKAKAEAEAEEAALEAEMLGIKESEPAESPVWKERHSEATRTIHELSGEVKDIKELLKTQGREIIATKDGLALIATDEAKDFDVNEIDMNTICNGLSQDELDALSVNPIEGAVALAKKISGAFASSVTPITARQKDAILTPNEQGECWSNFVGMKTGSGKAMFPDADNKEIQAQMNRAYEALSPELCALAENSKPALMAVQEILWSRVYRLRQAKVELLRQREAKVAEHKKLNKSGVEVSGSGSETGVKGQNVNVAAMSEADRIGKMIEDADV